MSEPMTDAQWSAYYDAMADTPPRDTLVFALSRFDDKKNPTSAIDLGCGEGRDSVELLRRGWHVLAVDGQEEGIRRLLARPDLPPNAVLTTQAARYEEVHLAENSALLVNASFSLPFCSPGYFPALWQQILASLMPGEGSAGSFSAIATAGPGVTR